MLNIERLESVFDFKKPKIIKELKVSVIKGVRYIFRSVVFDNDKIIKGVRYIFRSVVFDNDRF